MSTKTLNQNEVLVRPTAIEAAMLERIRVHIGTGLKPDCLPTHREAIAYCINVADSAISPANKGTSAEDVLKCIVAGPVGYAAASLVCSMSLERLAKLIEAVKTYVDDHAGEDNSHEANS